MSVVSKQVLRLCLRPTSCQAIQLANMSALMKDTDKIGSREVVGFGFNGMANYMDREDFPMPAIRFREETPEVKVLRKKEMSDWKNLSIEEKKVLYRSSFCQTFAEFTAATGEWKQIVGLSLIGISFAFWTYYFFRMFAYDPLPITFSEERRKAQLQRMIDLRVNPVEGLASQYDYKNDRWKPE